VATRLVTPDDAPSIAALLRSNRSFLAPWHPRRSEQYFTDAAQAAAVATALEQHEQGASVPLVIEDDRGDLVGTISVQSIIRGFLQSCSVGYWLAERAQGRGLATAAVRDATTVAFQDLRLHRVQAETLVDNVRSRRVLERAGFTHLGVAPTYICINGEWQDCNLYQLITPAPELVTVPA
jgi:ribosomal-protein-alanine N-acetyltransferase